MSKIIELKIIFYSQTRIFPQLFQMFQTYALQIYVCHDTVFQTFCDIKSKSLQCVYNVYNQRRRDETERIGKKVKINWISICKTNIKKWGI